jgi:hypothetical protein
MLGDIQVATRYSELFAACGLTSLASMMGYASCQLDKPGLPNWRERVRMELTNAGGQTVTLFLKRYRSPPLRAQLDRALAGSVRHGTAWIEWYWMGRLSTDGLSVAKPVAFGESMRGGREQASMVVAEPAQGISLEAWALGRRDRCSRAMIDELGAFIGRFHRLGYVHRDLYLSHVFYDETTLPHDRFQLIDLQRVMKPAWLRRRWMVKDLAALNYSTPRRIATAADRVRFLRRYLDSQRLGSSGKRLARRVHAKTNRITRHDRRREQRLGVASRRAEHRE